MEKARIYEKVGPASWYRGYDALDKEEGYMTANGEAFDLDGLTLYFRPTIAGLAESIDTIRSVTKEAIPHPAMTK